MARDCDLNSDLILDLNPPRGARRFGLRLTFRGRLLWNRGRFWCLAHRTLTLPLITQAYLPVVTYTRATRNGVLVNS